MDFSSLLDFINWNPSPKIFGTFLRWYGLLFAMCFYVAYLLFKRFFTVEKVPYYHLERLAIWMAVGTVVGARLGHCLFYQPEIYLANPIEILKIWEGGLASHGAAIGLILASYFYARRSKWSMLWLLDRVVIPVALAGLFIRTGNLINQEIMGTKTDSSFGFVFIGEDQKDPFFTARHYGDEVEVTVLSPEGENRWRGNMPVFRNADSLNYKLLGEVVIPPTGKPRPQTRTDKNPPKGELHYRLHTSAPMYESKAAGQDSADTRVAMLTHTIPHQEADFSGRWSGDSVLLTLTYHKQVRSEYLQLLKTTDGKNFTQIHKTYIKGSPNPLRFELVDVPQSGESPRYWLIRGRDIIYEFDLFARHPAQLYEAFGYLVIFCFLLWLYFRQEGKVPHGQLFGIFLITVFSWRFVIEFIKDGQVQFDVPLGLNMGHLLSIPFVLGGIFFLLLAMKKNNRSWPEEKLPKSDPRITPPTKKQKK